ncbi:transcription/translation regulatory transformer protein RfaH [Marinobacter adhaerens]|nr:transcription/translation regulatory transformer protein RfaH [Marinobacter adhaerens]MBW4980273.1 transcription/translation regulatory transformer protein RfaH [Marinobacter adhaerens]
MVWYVIQHKPGQGDRAMQNLLNQHVDCFHPKILVEKVRSGKRTQRLEPLFAGYLFIKLKPGEQNWNKLRSTRGILRIVGFGNTPATIDQTVIDQINARLASVTTQGGLKSGQAVELDDGPFKGLNAIFQCYDGDERAVVLINFMQKHQRLKVPITSLTLAN